MNILDPDVIVLGGGVSNIGRLYESVPRLWTPHVFSDRVATRLVRAKHGDSRAYAAPRGYGRSGRPADGDRGREAQTPETEETGTEDTEATGTERTERTAKPQRHGATEVERRLQQTSRLPISPKASTTHFDGSAVRRPTGATGSIEKTSTRIQRCIVVEVKSVEALSSVHESQLLTYLALTECPAGLLINFNVRRLMDGVKRMLNTRAGSNRSARLRCSVSLVIPFAPCPLFLSASASTPARGPRRRPPPGARAPRAPAGTAAR